MNVHDIHAKQDAAMVAGLREAGATIEPPASLDPTAMAVRAVRTVRRRRVVVAAATAVAAVVLAGAGIGAAGAIYADRQGPLPGDDKSTTDDSPSPGPTPSPSPSAVDEPTEYLETGGGTLPVLAGVQHGVVEGGGAAPYILGGLWYEVPPGGWSAVGDVNAGGVAGWLDPGRPEAQSIGLEGTIDDMDATIELRNVFDVADWTVPATDSGATTLDIEGADLVVIEQHKKEGAVRPVTITIRSGDEGWIIDTRFAANAQGDTMLRDFVGNLWLKEAGEPDWYLPAYSHPVLDAIDQGVPAGWIRTEHNGLKFAVPQGWVARETEGEFSPGVEWTGEGSEAPERVYVQGGKPGGNWWSQSMTAPESQLIDVPGADYAEVQPTAYNVDGAVDYYGVSIYLHQEDQGENLFLVVEFDGGEQGLQDLHTFLGTLDFRR